MNTTTAAQSLYYVIRTQAAALTKSNPNNLPLCLESVIIGIASLYLAEYHPHAPAIAIKRNETKRLKKISHPSQRSG
jgi:hypothetical protein